MDKGKGKETRRLVGLVTSLRNNVEPLVIPEEGREEAEGSGHTAFLCAYRQREVQWRVEP